MMQWILLSVLGVGILGGITGSAPQAIDLMPGQVYRTGSPLSQPGIIGLVGGVAGTHTGGGYEVWQGPHVAASADVLNTAGAWMPATSFSYMAQGTTYSHEQAQAAQDGINWAAVPNQLRTVVPDCAGQLFVTYAPDAEIGAVAQYTCE
jgi:hypothetical protein